MSAAGEPPNSPDSTKFRSSSRILPIDRLLEIALIENIQREDLNPIETAHAFERLGRELDLSQRRSARRTGKDRTSIANMIRLLKLPDEVQLLVAERRLSMGHARAILGLADPGATNPTRRKGRRSGSSVRQVERTGPEGDIETARDPIAKEQSQQDPNVKAAVAELESALGTRVRIVEKSDQRGRIEIEYYSQEELNRLYRADHLGRRTQEVMVPAAGVEPATYGL